MRDTVCAVRRGLFPKPTRRSWEAGKPWALAEYLLSSRQPETSLDCGLSTSLRLMILPSFMVLRHWEPRDADSICIPLSSQGPHLGLTLPTAGFVVCVGGGTCASTHGKGRGCLGWPALSTTLQLIPETRPLTDPGARMTVSKFQQSVSTPQKAGVTGMCCAVSTAHLNSGPHACAPSVLPEPRVHVKKHAGNHATYKPICSSSVPCPPWADYSSVQKPRWLAVLLTALHASCIWDLGS